MCRRPSRLREGRQGTTDQAAAAAVAAAELEEAGPSGLLMADSGSQASGSGAATGSEASSHRASRQITEDFVEAELEKQKAEMDSGMFPNTECKCLEFD